MDAAGVCQSVEYTSSGLFERLSRLTEITHSPWGQFWRPVVLLESRKSADNSAVSAGAVYLYSRNGPTWSQQAYVKASNTDAFDYFET
jgi:hypothetical protein